MATATKIPIEKIFQITDAVKSRSKVPTYLVGGAVRDLILFDQLPVYDLDFTVEGDAKEIAGEVQTVLKGEVKSFEAFQTAKLLLPGENIEIDFVSCRKESYERPGGLPVVEKANLKHDLARRDFTLNSLAIPINVFADYLIDQDPKALQANLVDYHGGINDLLSKQIRVLHDDSFIDDPTRIFRAVRYVTRLEATLEPHTKDLLEKSVQKGALGTISPIRALNELKKILIEPTRVESIVLLGELGVLEALPWIDVDRRAAFRQIAERLVDFKLKPKDLYYSSFVTIPFFLQNEIGVEFLSALGWKKKVILDFHSEVTKANAGDETASNEALIVSMAMEPTQKKQAELTQRTLLTL